MSLDFLTVGFERLEARTPITHIASRQGARMGRSAGFEVALAFENVGLEVEAARESVVLCDTSHTRKVELQGRAATIETAVAELQNGGNPTPNQLVGGAWWCRWHPERAMLVADPLRTDDWPDLRGSWTDALDVTGVWCSLTVVGPSATELISRVCSLDLRRSHSHVGDFHPASIARTPGAILNEGDDRYRLFVGWAVGEYAWTVLADAAKPLGGRPVGLECLASLACEGPRSCVT